MNSASKHFLICLLILSLAHPACAQLSNPAEQVPFVPTPIEVVDRMLEFGAVKKGDILYDLGSGDGRIVIRAAKKYGIRAVGIEMDWNLVALARREAKREGVENLAEFHQGDALKTDVSAATIITLYMLPSFNQRLRPMLEQQLKPGARVVAHDFPIEGWAPTQWEEMPLMDTRPQVTPHQHILYLYEWTPKTD
jgi:ubiquinone/menaquinone biosynthesis C-methylase UbiE